MTMSSDVSPGQTQARLADDFGTIFRIDTAWGYRLMRNEGRARLRARAELAMRLLSVLSFLMMAGLWLLPGASFALELLGLKVGLSISLGSVGLSLGYLAERGLSREVQIDQQREQLRVVWRNRRADTRLQTVIGFDEIGSIFLRRSLAPIRVTRLDLRYGTRREVVTLFEGDERELRHLWRTLNAGLKASRQDRDAHATVAPRSLFDV